MFSFSSFSACHSAQLFAAAVGSIARWRAEWDHGVNDDDEIAGTDSGEEDNGGEESSYTEIGDFGGLDGWSILPDPAKTEEEWSAMKKKCPWNNRRLAHIWDPPFGWEISSFSLWEKRTPVFYYSNKRKISAQTPSWDLRGWWPLGYPREKVGR